MSDSEYSEYIDPSEATKIRVFHEGNGFWSIDAADDSDRYTDHNWTHDGSPDKRLTRERAMQLVPEFVAHLGLPAGLPIEVRECDPARVVEVVRQNIPARIACHDEGGGEWSIDAEDACGRVIRDEHGNFPASIWHNEEAVDDFRPMARDAAISAAVALAVEIGHPSLPVYVCKDGTVTLVAGGAT